MLSPRPTLSARFRRPRLLIIGCGDIGLRVARLLQQQPRIRLYALTSQPARGAELRALGITPLYGNLDQPASLQRLAALAPWVLHLAPPAATGTQDLRTQALLQALRRRRAPRRFIYMSTTGIYGDAKGALIDETYRAQPQSARAQRRQHAEQLVRQLGRRSIAACTILRAPGIYALDRPQGDPRTRLQRRTPVLQAHEDVYTNHIHADDLARACLLALTRGTPQRAFNICDDSQLKMGDYFDLVAKLCQLPAPERISREQAAQYFSPMQRSFLNESRRLQNLRMKRELGLQLSYPSIQEGLKKTLSLALE